MPRHVHGCPDCYRDIECDDSCDIEEDLASGRLPWLPRGAYVVCDDCTRTRTVTVEVVWAVPHDPGDGSECMYGPCVDGNEIRCENSLCRYGGDGAPE